MRVTEVMPLRRLRLAALAAAASILFGCTSTPNRAPVEDRMATPRATTAATTPAATPASAPGTEPAKPPVAEGGARAGYYTVKPGDTLIRIGLDTGQNWKDIVRWNNLENPNVIEVGQALRVVAPGVDPAAATSRPVASTRTEPRPLEARPGASGAAASGPAATITAGAAPAATPTPAPLPGPGSTTATREGDED